jgi:prefoldin subunit 5
MSEKFDNLLLGIGAIAKVEIEKALKPLQNRVAQLEAEVIALKDTLKTTRSK